jgi:hypothetical protein
LAVGRIGYGGVISEVFSVENPTFNPTLYSYKGKKVWRLEIGEHGSETELAWAAGFFDGEGYIGCSLRDNGTKRYRRADIQITQKYPEVLYRFAKAVGVGNVGGPYISGTRTMYKYSIGNIDGINHVFNLLKPYLSIRKREQAEDAIARFEEWM